MHLNLSRMMKIIVTKTNAMLAVAIMIIRMVRITIGMMVRDVIDANNKLPCLPGLHPLHHLSPHPSCSSVRVRSLQLSNQTWTFLFLWGVWFCRLSLAFQHIFKNSHGCFLFSFKAGLSSILILYL